MYKIFTERLKLTFRSFYLKGLRLDYCIISKSLLGYLIFINYFEITRKQWNKKLLDIIEILKYIRYCYKARGECRSPQLVITTTETSFAAYALLDW